MIESGTPNLWEIRAGTDHATAIAVIVIALTHTARLVNVENNLNETQIGEIANDVLEDFGYLKVEELKYILKTAVKSQKIFGRLDYNVVMNWFTDYDAVRTEIAMSVSHNEEMEQRKAESKSSETAVTWEVYVNRLWDLAMYADSEAVEKLCQILDTTPSRFKLMTAEETHRKNLDFKQYYYNYIRQKK